MERKDNAKLFECEVNKRKQAEQRYRTLFEQSLDSILVIDPKTLLPIEFNDRACQELGYSHDEFKKLRITDHESTETAKITRKYIDEIMLEGQGILETEHKTKDGYKKHVQLAVNVIELNCNKVLHVIYRDITRYKQSEARLKRMVDELSRSNRELEQFAYVASHDLQEPLRMVASFAQLLTKRYHGQLDSDADEFIDYIVDGATRMQSLINGLLKFSRVGTQGKEFTPTDVNVVVEEVIRNLQISIQETGAKITYGELPKITADTSQLIQLFQNLVANAIKFHSDASPQIRIEAYHRDRQWVFSIHDNGIGIEEEYLDRIFQIFQRLHRREQYDGTGIGLAICKRIAERHGGRIWVDSVPNLGSSFHFSIPDKEGK